MDKCAKMYDNNIENSNCFNNSTEKTYQSHKDIKIEIIEDKTFDSIFASENNGTIKEEYGDVDNKKLFHLENNNVDCFNNSTEKTYQSHKDIKIEIIEDKTFDSIFASENNGTIKEEYGDIDNKKLLHLENNNVDCFNSSTEKTYQSHKDIKIEIIEDKTFDSIFACENNSTIKEEYSDVDNKKLLCLENNNVDDLGKTYDSRKKKDSILYLNTHGKIMLNKPKVLKNSFSLTADMSQCMSMHAGVKPHKCSVCQNSFSYLSKLKIHMRKHSDENPYQFSVCQNVFSQSTHLKSHMRTHSGEKPIQCSVCQKLFSRLSNLNVHMRIHSGEKPYKCSVCKKSFSQLSSLNIHMITHSGEKPHKCSVCKKLFSSFSNLNIHMITHSGVKPHKCSVCQKSFSQSAHLKTHMRTHSGDKPHKCSVCQKSFSQSAHLKKHMRTHSGDKL